MLFRAAANGNHSILLKWNPPAPKPGVTVASYEVYRSLGDGRFDKLASGVRDPSYVDHQVTTGNTYNYYVRAVDAQGNVGPGSNRASATIPP